MSAHLMRHPRQHGADVARFAFERIPQDHWRNTSRTGNVSGGV